ncbi:MAG: hypothetical protein HY738_23325, partial [Bacteroidia bacterium]|nr:hypothetical protein [Bacteroidia bacterium]
ELKQLIKEGEKKLYQSIDRKVMDLVKKAFSQAMTTLNEYSWFPSHEGKDISGKKEKEGKESKEKTSIEEKEIPLGIMQNVKIIPKYANVSYNVPKKFTVKAFNEVNEEISTENIQFEWTAINNLGLISMKDKESIIFTPKSKPELELLQGIQDSYIETIKIFATQNQLKADSEAQIVIAQEKPKSDSSFPPPNFENDHIGKWRSKWDENIFQITINSAHTDFVIASNRGFKYQSYYIAKLYAKELILINYKEIPQELILEKLIELEQELEQTFFKILPNKRLLLMAEQ